ncbi:MAG: hypothetical protein R3C17_16035 [Planctomycetaceae bacterium]
MKGVNRQIVLLIWRMPGFESSPSIPFILVSCRSRERAYLWALISTVGERPPRVQAGRTASVAQWIKERTQPTELRVVTIGPRTGVIGLVGAAADPDLLPPGRRARYLESLKTLIDDNYSL